MDNADKKQEASKNILSWCLLVPDRVMPKVMERLAPSDFPDPDDQKIFGAIVGLYSRKENINLVTVANELKGKVDDLPGKIVDLIDKPFIGEDLRYRLLRKALKILGRYLLKKSLKKEEGGA